VPQPSTIRVLVAILIGGLEFSGIAGQSGG